MAHTYGEVMGLKRIFAVIIVLIFLLLFLDIYQEELAVEFGIAISVVTFVYGFFLNSIFTFIQRKFTDFAASMADLNANIQSFYDMMRMTGQPRLREKVRDTLVQFIASFKEISPRLYENNQKYVDQLFSLLKEYKIKSKKDELLFPRIINALNNLAINRERAELFGDRYFVGEIRFIFLALTSLVALMIMVLCVQSWYLVLFGLILVLALVFTSFLLFNLDRMRYGKMKIRMKNLDELIEAINKEW
jgi:hypothetical protein